MFENEYTIFSAIYNDLRELKLISHLIYHMLCLVILIHLSGAEHSPLLHNKHI